MLELSGLCCRRGGRLLFRDLSCLVSAGQALQVLGPNGSGKTSLLRAIGGLLRPAGGQVRWDRAPVPPGASLYVGHAAGLKGALSPLENLRLEHALNGAPGAPVAAALDEVGLTSYMHVPVCALSAGQRRLAGLARLRTRRARLWLLDEPCALLDGAARTLVMGWVEAHCRAGGIAVLALHDPAALDLPVIHRRALARPAAILSREP